MNRIDKYSEDYVKHISDETMKSCAKTAFYTGFESALREIVDYLSDAISEDVADDTIYYYTGRLDKNETI